MAAPATTTEKDQFTRQLEEDVARATSVIQKLTSSKEEMKHEVPRFTEKMPRSELHYASGLAFTHVKKVGAGLSFEHGTGFVIAKLPSDTASPPTGPHGGSPAAAPPAWAWSAPLFLRVTAAGFGFTLGYAEVDSVTVLDTPEAVHSFKKTVVELDSDVTGAAFSAAAHLPATAANLSHLALSDKEFTYSIASGVMVDVSLTGLVFSVDAARNKSAYGAFASPAAVLEGGVRPPGAMAELYAALDRAMQAHDVEEGGEGAGAGAGAAELAHAHGE